MTARRQTRNEHLLSNLIPHIIQIFKSAVDSLWDIEKLSFPKRVSYLLTDVFVCNKNFKDVLSVATKTAVLPQKQI